MKKRFMTSLTAAALVGAMSAGAQAAGHSEKVVAFDPEIFQFSEGVAVDADGNVYASVSPHGQLVRDAPVPTWPRRSARSTVSERATTAFSG